MTIKRINTFPCSGFENLLVNSQDEGFRFLQRLLNDWEAGINRFDQPGEGLFQMIHEDELIGIGGINRDPFGSHENCGRLRRMYIQPQWRRQGSGTLFVQSLITHATQYFDVLELRTDNPAAAAFYENMGFHAVQNHSTVTHRMPLKS